MVALERKIELARQNSLLNEAIEKRADLLDLLKENRLSYDQLRYEKYGGLTQECLEPIEVMDTLIQSKEEIPAVSFFSGAGGLDVGFSYAGFTNLISIEVNEIFCNTLRKNNPETLVVGPPDYSGDVSQHEELEQILLEHGITENFPGVFHGGPPCQSFSVAANQRFAKNTEDFKRKGFDDEKRGKLIFDYLWYIKRFRPMAFLIENVSGISDCDADGNIQKALDELGQLGYTISGPMILNAANYGVPQNRRRWIIMGTRSRRAILFPQPSLTPTPCGSVFLRPLDNVKNHIIRHHKAKSVLRYVKLSYGSRDKMGRIDRLDPREPAKTVIAGGTNGGGRSHLHPFIPRTLSVRECARLQTFPDEYEFTGSTSRQFTQVGNAVPPLLAYRLAQEVKMAMTG